MDPHHKKNGLTDEEANARLKSGGYNEINVRESKNILRIAKEVFKEPILALLIACAGLYMLLGDFTEGIILLCSILVIIAITFYQYRRTERALEVLRNLSSPRALVIRGGVEKRVPGREVVPGDLLKLTEGDRISADAVLLESTELMVDESILTGESFPVKKSKPDPGNPGGKTGRVYSGTLVVRGRGLASVVATGVHTEFGKIGVSLGTIQEEPTRLQAEIKSLNKKLIWLGILCSASVTILFYVTRGNFINSLLYGLSSAMALMPEEFPMAMIIFLALGAWRLSRKNVLTRKPAAIETLGAATVLCCDKTGTITQNKMELAALYTGTELIEKSVFLQDRKKTEELISVSYNACPDKPSDPMEIAIVAMYGKISGKNSEQSLLKEYGLNEEFPAMTRVLKNDTTHEIKAFCKGAPETIFSLCHLDDSVVSEYHVVLQQMAARGLRILGVAEASLNTGELPESQTAFNFRFLGFLGFEDPIRPEVPAAVQECHEAGVRVVMITGDFPLTAENIARQIGLTGENMVMTGAEMDQISDADFIDRVKKVRVFARVVPAQKLRIVNALKENGEVVAMTGDGVNDAPALKAANIGISMGIKGTDVAREASSLVLLDDNFASIAGAIRSGRRIFDNLLKAFSFIISVHIPILGLTLLPGFLSDAPVLLWPIHIVFLELIIDPVSSIAFESEQDEKDSMKRPPRDPRKKFFTLKIMLSALARGLVLLAMILVVYFMSADENHSEKEIRAITFAALIMGNIGLVLTDLSKTRNVLAIILDPSLAVKLILAAAMGMLLLVLTVPFLQTVFSMDPVPFIHFIPALAGAAIVVMIYESLKWWRNKRYRYKLR